MDRARKVTVRIRKRGYDMNTDVMTAIKTRRSTRKYRQEPVESEKLEKIIEAGRYAPSGGNNQTAHFIVIRDAEVMKKLAELAAQRFAAMEEKPGLYKSILNSIRASKAGGYVFHYNAPVLIVTANLKDYQNSFADCSCALENMMLMSNELDLGSCWINQLRWLNEDPVMTRYLQSLGMDENEKVYGALAVGYADTEDGLPVREPLPRTGNRVTYVG